MNTEILNKFTAHLKNTLAKAHSLAAELSSSGIHPEHLLLAMVLQRGSMGGEILRQNELSSEELRQMLIAVNQFSPPDEPARSPRLSAEAKRAIEKAVMTANTHQHRYVGTEHLLFGLLEIGSPVISAILSDQEIDSAALYDQVNTTLNSTSRFPEITETFESGRAPVREDQVQEQRVTVGLDVQDQKTPALEFFTVDLTSPEIQRGIDPVIGRNQEIERMIQVLCRRSKNNPVLLGEPGVGKTAIIEGLAKKIVEGEVPELLASKRILSLDLGMMVAGTIYRGEFEGRIKQLTDEMKANPDIILFIDELHNIMGAGSTNGSMDAANLLKPALARGQLRCIGATTIAEYKKHIESDGALERRFQPVAVDQPSPDAAKEILRGLKGRYEKHHEVTITDEAIDAAVELSERYLTDRFLPDKAIDLIDEASARARVSRGGDSIRRRAARIETDLERIRSRKDDAVRGENFIEALKLKGEEESLVRELKELAAGDKSKGRRPTVKIGREQIAEIVSQATGVPLHDMVMEEKAKLLGLESNLRRRIVGQEDAVAAVAEMVRRAKAGMAHPDRPLASFMFLGPSGVGKTELTKVLAEEIFNDPEALIRIDMSEFSEGFNVSKLVGAPAGYVGYRESTKLTDTVKRKPHSLVLFDEIEKAHPDVHNILLQILEDGHITDATGRKINFKNTIIVMTSNVGAGELRTEGGIGFSSDDRVGEPDVEEARSAINGELERSFRPEFLNRIDRVVMFRPLSQADLKEIVGLQIGQLSDRLSNDYGLTVTADEPVLELLAERSYNPIYGARPVRRQIQELIESPLAKSLLSDEFEGADGLVLSVENGKIGVAKSVSTPRKVTAKAKKTAAKSTASAAKTINKTDKKGKKVKADAKA
ncbi:MAG: ATP-dependent Clp protease ATP-binding subunit [bacterium]